VSARSTPRRSAADRARATRGRVLVDGKPTQIEPGAAGGAARGRAAIGAGARRHPRREYLWQPAWCFHRPGEPGRQRLGEAERLPTRSLRGKAPRRIRRGHPAAARPCGRLPAAARKGGRPLRATTCSRRRYMTTSGISRTGCPSRPASSRRLPQPGPRTHGPDRRSLVADGADGSPAPARAALQPTTSRLLALPPRNANAHETTCPSPRGPHPTTEATPRHGRRSCRSGVAHPSPFVGISAETG